MNILVIGGTGLVGSHVVQGLVAKGEQVHVLTRSADKADGFPLGASGIIGDLHKPESLRWAMRGIDRVFLVTPLSPDGNRGGAGGRGGSEPRRCSAPRLSVDLSCRAGSIYSPF